MDIKNDVKAKVFQLQESDKMKHTYIANLSTYEGKDKDGNAEYSSWRVKFVGKAFEKAKNLKNKDTIILTEAKVSNTYDKKEKRLYVNITCFDFEPESSEEER